MAVDESEVIRLRDDFYRDGFNKVLISLVIIITAIVFLILLSIYIYTSKPPPVNFKTDNEWRILAPVPLNEPYLSTADLIQWVSTALPGSISFDFINYTKNLQNAAQYFTNNGWPKFLDLVNQYANYNNVINNKLFVSGTAAGAPFILNQGMLEGKYGWWVQMPLMVNNVSFAGNSNQEIMIQALVVRVPTLNNISGVGIDNLIVNKVSGATSPLE